MPHPSDPPSRTASVIRIADAIKSRSKQRQLVKAVRAATEAALAQASPDRPAGTTPGIAGIRFNRGATNRSPAKGRREIRFVRSADPGAAARFVRTSDTRSRTRSPLSWSRKPSALSWFRQDPHATRDGSGASGAAARLLKRLTAPLERFEMERPTKVILALTAIFTALIGVPAASAWAIHRTSPDLVGRWIDSADAQTTISVYRVGQGTVSHVPLNNYIVNVLAAELPPTAPMQSLEAAAVATRTYIVYLITHRGTGIASIAAQHGALVTDDGLLDLPWLTEAQQVQKYGANTATYTARLQEAVIATDGEVLAYQGSPIPAFMFALSPGRTRDASAVFGRNLPYLPSIACPDDQADPAATRTLTFTPAQLASRLAPKSGESATGAAPGGTAGENAAGTAAGAAAGGASSGRSASTAGATAPFGPALNPANFTVSSRGSDGFVKTVNMKGSVRAWTGIDFANRLGLPSADFTFAVANGDLVVTTKGVGTDIGMSLHEATVLADQGDSWQAIVHHFYPGTTALPDLPFVAPK